MFNTGGQEVSGGWRTRTVVLSRPGIIYCSTFCFNLIKDPVLHFLSQVRGIGTDIAIVSCMVFLAQVTFNLLDVVCLYGKLMPDVDNHNKCDNLPGTSEF